MLLQTPECSVFCVGWTGQEVASSSALWRPSAPKNYTKEDTIRAWIEDHKADAPVLPFVGEVNDIWILDSAGNQVFTTPDIVAFLRFADHHAGFSNMGALDPEISPKAVFVGFNVKQLFLSVAAELWDRGEQTPFRFWHATPGLFDINDLLIPGALRNGFDVGSLLAVGAKRFLPTQYHHLSGTGNAVMQTGESKALVALALCRYAKLI